MLVPLVVACALFMQMLDSTVIATALPTIARDFGKAPLVLKLGLSAYLVSLAVFIPISGWIADRFGSRTVFCSAIGLFMVSSMMCGMAQSFSFFVVSRFIQGIGGAMMVPVGRIVVVRSVDRDDLVTAFLYISVPATLGPLTGPVLGGFIATYFSWRWIFFINVPISIIGILLALRLMQNFREKDVPTVDLLGFLLSACGLSFFMFGASMISEQETSKSVAFAFLAAGALTVCAYVWRSHYEERPLLDLRFFRLRTFWVGVGGGCVFRIGFGALPLLLPLLLQVGFGLSPLHSGMLTCTGAIGSLFMRTLTKKLLRRFGFRRLLFVNALISASSIAVLGLFAPQTPRIYLILVLLIGGAFRVLQFSSLNSICYAEVPEHDVSSATSLFSTVQQLSVGIGVTVGALFLQASSYLQHHGHIVAADFWPAFLAVGVLSAFSAISALSLLPSDGAEMAGRGRARSVAH